MSGHIKGDVLLWGLRRACRLQCLMDAPAMAIADTACSKIVNSSFFPKADRWTPALLKAPKFGTRTSTLGIRGGTSRRK